MPQLHPPARSTPSTPAIPTARNLLFTIAAALFIVEVALMLVLHHLQMSAPLEMAIDSVALVLLLLPVLYWRVLRPIRTEQQRNAAAQQALREALGWNQGILEAASDGILITDEAGIIEGANPAVERMFGYTRDELLGNSLNMLIPEPARKIHDRHIAAYVHQGGVRNLSLDREIRGLRRDGVLLPLEINITELNGGRRRHFVALVRDISARRQAEDELRQAKAELEERVTERTAELQRINAELQREVEERKRMQKEFEHLATTDTLTGIRNRRAFDAALESEINRVKRYGDGLSLILLDIDHFKRINDRHGHQAGDRVLVELARVLAGRLRTSETFARWGGEEFIILAPHTDAERARHLAEEMRGRVAKHDFPGVGQVTVSGGVTQYAPGDSADALWKRADSALYQAKERGRNRIEMELAG